MATEYRVWSETGDLIAETGSKSGAELAAQEARALCDCGTDGLGDECGVTAEHGISIDTVTDGYIVPDFYEV